jgi:excisionase family DNA binding protein
LTTSQNNQTFSSSHFQGWVEMSNKSRNASHSPAQMHVSGAGNGHPRRFLTPVQAAEYLGDINSRTVTRWAREGYLPSYPIGEGKKRLWRFLASDLEQWMLSRRTGQIPFDIEPYTATLSVATDAPTRRHLEG